MFARALLALIVLATGGASANPHKVTSLPHYNDRKAINFDQYAGHIALPSNGQKMFYWLVESETNPATDPLVLWLNGGPGCSSLGGFFTELGPFVVDSDLSVKRNPYAWNRKANMVFLDSPAGVGFSTPRLNATEYNDDTTTDRAYEFLAQFLALYPAYQHREFYITGESYAGVYIPYLVHKLVTQPMANLTLTGFAIGNPFTDSRVDASAYLEYFYSHGLVSIETYKAARRDCGPDGVGNCLYGIGPCSDACVSTFLQAISAADWLDSSALNPYYIYGDVCKLEDGQASSLTSAANVRPLTHRGVVGPCQDRFTTQYLQLQAVQDAVHVDGGYINWTDCNTDINTHYTRSASSLSKYPAILAAGLKALIYSGDADSNVNFLGTERWLTADGLNLTVREKWQAWFGPDSQLAGYSTRYTNLTFTTVKGAGHMVPATRPLHALYMFECFVYGTHVCLTFAYPKDGLEYLSGADLTAPITTGDFMAMPLWWALGALLVVVAIFGGWRFYVAQQVKHHNVKYTELIADSKPAYTS
ncbi:Aste57867_8608 [Aphanomyces stellatus]|uniref:Carboxypeptidase n=1 Tax=Aphanomyces stellatus TaxID=120398 RepID=A0A485KKS8_9STRA|nr:hypothetical protein As57867_008574 [Aphanomyces stellatus]VFT85494.1 Aste57867_8608 [Aphanomyces stellatus]